MAKKEGREKASGNPLRQPDAISTSEEEEKGRRRRGRLHFSFPFSGVTSLLFSLSFFSTGENRIPDQSEFEFEVQVASVDRSVGLWQCGQILG